jgi:hypothetical protein
MATAAVAPSAAAPRPAATAARGPVFAFGLLLVFLVLEYARPAGLAALKIQFVASLILPVLWLAARDRPRSGILWAQLVVLATSAVAVPFAYNYFAAYLATRTLLGNVGVALAMSWLAADRERFRKVCWLWMGIFTWLGFFSLSHGGRGPGGFLGDENDLALAMCTALPFAWFGLERAPGTQRFIAAGMGVMMILGVVASFSRGGFVGLVCVVLFCVATSRRRLLNLGLLAVGAGLFLLLASPEYKAEMATISDTDDGTASDRKFLWTTATNIWLEYPILGAGGQNFNFIAGEHQPTDPPWDKPEYQERNWSGTTVHSLYYQTLSEQGTVGIVLLAYLAIAHLRLLQRLRRDVRRRRDAPRDLVRETEQWGGALMGGVIGFLAAGAFISVAYYPYLFYFSGLGVALDAWVRRELARLPGAAASAAR